VCKDGSILYCKYRWRKSQDTLETKTYKNIFLTILHLIWMLFMFFLTNSITSTHMNRFLFYFKYSKWSPSWDGQCDFCTRLYLTIHVHLRLLYFGHTCVYSCDVEWRKRSGNKLHHCGITEATRRFHVLESTMALQEAVLISRSDSRASSAPWPFLCWL
jgi:hypothetical protein